MEIAKDAMQPLDEIFTGQFVNDTLNYARFNSPIKAFKFAEGKTAYDRIAVCNDDRPRYKDRPWIVFYG